MTQESATIRQLAPEEVEALLGRHDILSPRPWPHKTVSLSTIILDRYPCDGSEGATLGGNALLRLCYGGEGKHRYDRHPSPDNPMVRHGRFRRPVNGQSPPPEFVRDNGTDNLVVVTGQWRAE